MTEQISRKDTFDQFRRKINDLMVLVGDPTLLMTDDQESVVAAINELKGRVDTAEAEKGILSSLTTTNKASLVAAINEIYSLYFPEITAINDELDDIETDISDANAAIGVINALVPFGIDNIVDRGSPASGSTVDLDTSQYKTHKITCPSGTLTIAASDMTIGREIRLVLVNPGVCSFSWGFGIVWAAGSVPSFTSSGIDQISLTKLSATEVLANVVGLDYA